MWLWPRLPASVRYPEIRKTYFKCFKVVLCSMPCFSALPPTVRIWLRLMLRNGCVNLHPCNLKRTYSSSCSVLFVFKLVPMAAAPGSPTRFVCKLGKKLILVLGEAWDVLKAKQRRIKFQRSG